MCAFIDMDTITFLGAPDEAHKTCNSDGNWKINQDTLLAWTNYTSCVDLPDLHVSTFTLMIQSMIY